MFSIASISHRNLIKLILLPFFSLLRKTIRTSKQCTYSLSLRGIELEVEMRDRKLVRLSAKNLIKNKFNASLLLRIELIAHGISTFCHFCSLS